MAIIKGTRNTNIGCGEKGTLVHCWWECKLVQSLSITENSIDSSLKVELPYGPIILLWGI